MPATLDVDKEQVRMLVLEVGCHEAARRMGIAEGTVRQWALRGRWVEDRPASIPLPPSRMKPVTLVTSPADALVEIYKEQRVKTRLNMSSAVLKASQSLEEKDGNSLLSDGGTTLKTVAQAASLVHGWQEQSQARVVVCLQALEQSQGAELNITTPEVSDVYDADMDPENY